MNRNINNTELLQKCDDIFKEQLDSGVIEIVNDKQGSNQVSYLPHRPVVKPDRETTKVRVVFDCSASNPGESSFNLVTGLSLTPSPYSVLLKFRSYDIAFCSDIEKAFLQISIDPDYRDF